MLDLSRRDADVAIRLTNDPPETLVGRRICTGRWAIYRRGDVADPLGAEPVESAAFIGFGGNMGPASARRWIEANVDPERIVAKANSTHCMLELARQGVGAVLLPCFLGDLSPDLVTGRISAARARCRLVDADPFRSSPRGACASLHGIRRGGARETSPRDRGRRHWRDRMIAAWFACSIVWFTSSRTASRSF